jgi:nicotinamidase-related amidase
MSKVCLLIIDPQQDFMEGGSLAVTGAKKDMERIAAMIDKHGNSIDEVSLTMDSHFLMHVAHPLFWQDASGKQPAPFTLISEDDLLSGKWRPKNPAWKEWALQYVRALKASNKFALCIWPVHCVIGSIGQTIEPTLFDSVTRWETKYSAIAPRLTKGSNPFTEHFSCVKAEVARPDDPGTRINSKFIDTLKQYDDILIAGEALSHCVNFSIRDIANEFSEDQVKKFILLEDGSSSVTGFEQQGETFVKEMVAKGMRLAKTDTFFK